MAVLLVDVGFGDLHSTKDPAMDLYIIHMSKLILQSAVTKDDVKIAKNYLTEIELQRLNLLVSQFLDYAEFQALEQIPMSMRDWISALDKQIVINQRKLLEGSGCVSHQQAMDKAEKEFEIYRKREMEQLESDFDKEVKRLKKN